MLLLGLALAAPASAGPRDEPASRDVGAAAGLARVTSAGPIHPVPGAARGVLAGAGANAPSVTDVLPSTSEVGEPVVEPVVRDVVEPVVEPVVRDVVEPVVEPVLEPVLREVVEPVVARFAPEAPPAAAASPVRALAPPTVGPERDAAPANAPAVLPGGPRAGGVDTERVGAAPVVGERPALSAPLPVEAPLPSGPAAPAPAPAAPAPASPAGASTNGSGGPAGAGPADLVGGYLIGLKALRCVAASDSAVGSPLNARPGATPD